MIIRIIPWALDFECVDCADEATDTPCTECGAELCKICYSKRGGKCMACIASIMRKRAEQKKETND
jgi:hypothetical protein